MSPFDTSEGKDEYKFFTHPGSNQMKVTNTRSVIFSTSRSHKGLANWRMYTNPVTKKRENSRTWYKNMSKDGDAKCFFRHFYQECYLKKKYEWKLKKRHYKQGQPHPREIELSYLPSNEACPLCLVRGLRVYPLPAVLIHDTLYQHNIHSFRRPWISCYEYCITTIIINIPQDFSSQSRNSLALESLCPSTS